MYPPRTALFDALRTDQTFDGPVLSKGFYLGCEDIGATRRFVVYPGTERYPIAQDVTAISLVDMMQELRTIQ